MNFGVVALALLLCCGSVLAVGIIAGAPHEAYIDSYGNTTPESTNITQSNITSSTAPISNAAGGVVIVIGFFVIIVSAMFLYGSFKKNSGYSGRRW